MVKVKITTNQIVQLKQKGITQKEMAEIFEVTQQTIIRWKKQKFPFHKRKRKPKSYGDIPRLLKSYISKNINATQKEMANYIFKETGQSISQQKVSRILRKHGITYKKLTYHYVQLDEEKAKAFNEEIKPLLKGLPFIAIDECSFYPNLDPKFGYSLKGERAVSKKPGHKGKHYTLLFAISNLKKNGVIHWKLVKGGVNWKIFYEFLEEINPIGDKKNILLIDNARIHTAPSKRAEAKLPTTKEQMARKNIEVRFITTYAPMINPAELCFNTLRQQTERQRSRSYEEMEKSIEKTVKFLNKKDLSKYFWHCAKYFDKKDSTKKETVKITYNGKGKNKRSKKDLLPKKRRSIK